MTIGNVEDLKLEIRQGEPSPDSHQVILLALKATIRVSGLSAEEAAEIRRTWARCLWSQTAGAPDDAIVDHSVIERDPQLNWTEFHERLVGTVTALAIASCRGEYFMFHAAALADPDSGRTMVLVAPSGTGKTTATRKLGTTLAYLTDETAAFLADGSMLGYPKPLSLFSATGVRPKNQHSPEELGLRPSVDHARLTGMAVLDRVRDQQLESAKTVRLSRIEALERLIPESSSLSCLPRGLSRLCTLIDSLGAVHALRYSEAEQLIPLIARELSARDSPTPEYTDEWQELPLARDERAANMPGLYRRLPVDDAVLVDGSVALLKGEEFTALDGIGPLIWETLTRWSSIDDLTESLTLEFGPHPEALSIIQATLNTLTGRRLVEVSAA